jgi:class 3 adenylate cyclase
MDAAVTCASCQAENPAGASFCMSCGKPLQRLCPSCGAEAAAGANFCGNCGAALAASAGAETSTDPPDGTPGEAEQRRTVTVLFADLSGFTSISERLDHETVKALVERCLTRLADEVERYGGRVDKFIGDNVMAVFGAPQAHEDDPARAVRAALGMQAAMAGLREELGARFGMEPELRVGVNTGEVLAGRIGGDYTVVGDAVNVAARLQVAAPIGGVLAGERTRRLSAGEIVYAAIEPLTLKGKSEPVPAWQALELGADTHATQGKRPTTPLIGRAEELARLEAAIDRVSREGGAHLLTLVGQAGVGKSRLLLEFQQRLSAREIMPLLLSGRCTAFGQSGSYGPLIEMLQDACSIAEGDDAATARAKLTARLVPILSEREDAAEAERRIAPLARLFGAGDGGSAAAADDQQSAREGFFGSVRALIEALARERPVVLVWEDIHWADEGSLDLIEYLSRWLRAPVMQLCLARDEVLERRPDWSVVRRTVSTTFLEPLPADDARRLVAAPRRRGRGGSAGRAG